MKNFSLFTISILFGLSKISYAQEVKIFTDPPLKKGVIYLAPSIAVSLVFKIENGCVYAHGIDKTNSVDKEKMLPVFVYGSKPKGKDAILIRQYSGKDVYTAINKILVFSADPFGKIAAPYEKKKYSSCMKDVNKVIRIYSGGSSDIKRPPSVKDPQLPRLSEYNG